MQLTSLTLDEIREKYPDVDINRSGGTDSYRDGLLIVERDPVAVVIKHPNEDEFLIAKWKGSDWNGFLTGGIEDGDTLEQTVQKEIQEETGYKNVAYIKAFDFYSHSLFFHPVKNVNRLAHYRLVYAELEDLTRDEVSEDQKAIADFVWIPKADVLDLLTRNDMKLLWKHFLHGEEK